MVGRCRALPVVLALTAGVAGCGGSSGPSDQQRVRTTLERFTHDVAAGDVVAICDRLLDPSLVVRINSVGLSCAQALRQGFSTTHGPQLVVDAVTVRGNRASARVRATAANQPATTTTLALVRIRGSWRVTSLGGAAPQGKSPAPPTTPGAGPSGGGD